ncbi:MAG: NUDIX hydrolase [Rhizobiales bacterium PAR1]|nr:MAG: NUDIX hydrolase [Rhizobiales bacterium PAR1]
MSEPDLGPDYPQIVPLRGLECRFEPMNWTFADENTEAIATHWARFIAEKPASFNGKVLIQHHWEVVDGVYRGRYLETDYAAFIAWRDFGHPGPPMRNGFAMAALQARDGAYLLGEMGAGTANAGKIFFAAGTPDRSDLTPDGRVDLAGSVLRELGEETGLRPEEVEVSGDWCSVLHGVRAAFMRPVRIDLPAEEARRLILARLPDLGEEELCDIHIARGPSDIDPARMPPFQAAYLAAMFRG